MMVVKAVLLVIIELLVYWVIGAFAAGFLSRKKQMNIGMQTVAGFLCYQILFQVFSFPFIITKRWFHELVTCWMVAIVVVLLLCIVLRRKMLASQLKELAGAVRMQPGYWIAGAVAVIAFCYYAVMNGRLDDDSVYYIGLANTTVDLNIMFRSNVYTGELQPSLYLRRIFTTFEINAAMLAEVFGIHPIIVMRLVRSSLNIILSAFSIHEIGKIVYTKLDETSRMKNSMVFTIVALYANFLMENSIFTSGTFLLHRAYEGKAYAAGTLVLFATVICLQLVMDGQKENYIWLLLLLWASSAVSTTAIVINLAVIAMWILVRFGAKFAGRYRSKVEEENAGC